MHIAAAGSEGDDLWRDLWRLYVDNLPVDREIDEDMVIEFFARHYAENALDEECLLYGILLYERAFTGDPALRMSDLARARDVLQAWRELTGETLDAVEDRLADAVDILGEA